MREDPRARLVRCERHGLAYDPERATGCALCRSESRRPSGFPPLDRVLVGLLAAMGVMLVGGGLAPGAAPAFERWLGPTGTPPASASVAARGSGAAPLPLRTGTFPLRTKNDIGRSGALFIPTQAAA